MSKLLRMCRYCRRRLPDDAYPHPTARACNVCRALPADVRGNGWRHDTRVCNRCGEDRPRAEYEVRARICNPCKTVMAADAARHCGRTIVGDPDAVRPREWLPPEPFIRRFKQVMARETWTDPGHGSQRADRGNARTVTQVCEAYGLSAKRWTEYKRGTAEHVDFTVVDRFLTATGLNWFDIWPPEEYPDVAALLGDTGEPLTEHGGVAHAV